MISLCRFPLLCCALLASLFLPTDVARADGAGSAIDFDGVDDEVLTVYKQVTWLYPLTLTAWVKTSRNANTFDGIAGDYIASSLNGYLVFLNNGRVRAWYFRDSANYVWDGGLGLDGGAIADGQWHHVAFVVDASGGRLYVDTVLKASRAWTGTPGATTSNDVFRVGNYGGGFFLGQIDQVTLWSTGVHDRDGAKPLQVRVQRNRAGPVVELAIQ